MFKLKLAGVAVSIALLAYGLSMAGTASANWLVGGTELASTAALSTTAAVDEHVVLKAAGVTVKCEGATLNAVAPEIVAPTSMVASSISFSECTANESCTTTKTIGTVPLTGAAVAETAPQSSVTFSPKTKTTLATIKFEGASCALLGVQPLTGKAKLKMPTGQEERTAQLASAATTEASGELKLGSSAAELKAGALLKLASEKAWSFINGKAAPPAPRIEQINFTGNSEVLIDHAKTASHEEVKKLVAEGKTPEAAKSMEAFDGDKIEWKSPKAGEVKKNWPLAYTLNTNVVIDEARIGLEAATQNFLKTELEGGVTLIAETTIEGKAVKVEEELTGAEVKTQMEGVGAHPTFLEFAKALTLVKLLQEVRYEKPTITWKWKATKTGGMKVEQEVGKSTHNIYTTFGASLKSMYFTMLAESTAWIEKEAKKEPTQAQVVAAVWKAFSGRPGIHVWVYNPSSAEGGIKQILDVLEYYEQMTVKEPLNKIREKEATVLAAVKNVNSLPKLLEYLDGECGSWQDAFVQALEGEHVEPASIMVVTKFKAGKEICEVAEECEMLVKNWKFPNAGLVNKPENVEKLEGIPGQGVGTPSSDFFNHQIVEIEKKVYDPAYGTGPISGTKGKNERSFEAGEEAGEIRLKYQQSAVGGFCKPSRTECGEEAELALQFTKTAGP